MKLTYTIRKFIPALTLAGILLFNLSLKAQTSNSVQVGDPDDLTPAFKPHGQLWGQVFGDYFYKAHADTVGGGRGTGQYSGVAKNSNAFQYRRIYLGYYYFFSRKISTEILLSSEKDVANGDLLQDGNSAPFIKWANLRIKDVFKGTDLIIGQQSTPAFSLLPDKVWSYRSVERTVADLRGTPSYDFGASLQGKFIPGNDNYGYNLMMANGSQAKPETDIFKWFYGDVYAKLFDKHIVLDLYSDYERLNWTPTWHHDRNMVKGFIAYASPKVTVGIEAFVNTIRADDIVKRKSDSKTDTINNRANAISVFVRGKIYKDILNFFVRYDTYNPSLNNSSGYSSISAVTSSYNPNTKEQFVTAGLDIVPYKNVHIIPNIWYDGYFNAGPKNYGNANNGYDLVYRLTVSYLFDAYPSRFTEWQ